MNKKRRFITNFISRIGETHLTSFAAHSAFYIIVSVIPIVFLVLFMMRQFNIDVDVIKKFAAFIMPGNLAATVSDIFLEVQAKTSDTVYVISFIAVWWASGRAILVIKNGLNCIYNIKETRNYFLLRAIATLYTLLFAAGIILSGGIFLFGSRIYHWLTLKIPFLTSVAFLGSFTRIIFSGIFLTLMFLMFYRFLPNVKMKMLHQLPGAIVSSVGWLICTYFFYYYIEFSSNLTYVYGSFATLVVAMLWLLACMNIFFVGALVNSLLFPTDVFLDCENIDIK